MILKYTLPADGLPRRIEDFLRKSIGFSVTQIKYLKHPERVYKNGIHARCIDIAMPGDELTLHFSEHEAPDITPEPIPLYILYEDNALLIVDKPAGLPMHPSTTSATGTLVNAVAHHYMLQGVFPRVRPVTRLDRNTTGVTVIAKIAHVQHTLQKQAKEGLFQKTYIGIATGIFEPVSGRLDQPIGRKCGSIVERQTDEEGSPSLTLYQTLETGELDGKTYSVVSFQPITGRTHQIRVHSASAGHSLVGDDLYGGSFLYEMQRQALHCAKIQLLHPLTGEPMEIKAPLPEDMSAFRKRLLSIHD